LVLLAHGGTVLRRTPVREVIIEDGVVRDVCIKSEDNEYERDRVIRADNVICTIPRPSCSSETPRWTSC